MPESTTGKDVEKRLAFDPNDLRAIASFDDAQRLLADARIELRDASTEIGDGFTLLEDKDTLINVPFIALQWSFVQGDFVNDDGEKTEFIVMRLVTGDGRKVVLTDGGTGIAEQIRSYEARTGNTGGLIVQRGLRKSEYENEHGAGVTHYLNV